MVPIVGLSPTAPLLIKGYAILMKKLRRSRLHYLRIEKAVGELSPLIWAAFARALNKWLKTTLAALEPQFKNLVIETRAVDPFDLRAVADMIANVSSLAEPPDFEDIANIISEYVIAELFLPRDPRAQIMATYLQEISIQRVTSIWTNITTPDRLARHLLEFKADGGSYLEISRKVQSAYSKQLYVAERLVRTTSNAGFNYGDFATKLQDGVEFHSWLSSRDRRVRKPPKSGANHAAMDGQRVRVGEPFVTPRGFRLLFPGDVSLGAPADEVINCRCTTVDEI